MGRFYDSKNWKLQEPNHVIPFILLPIATSPQQIDFRQKVRDGSLIFNLARGGEGNKDKKTHWWKGTYLPGLGFFKTSENRCFQPELPKSESPLTLFRIAFSTRIAVIFITALKFLCC